MAWITRRRSQVVTSLWAFARKGERLIREECEPRRWRLEGNANKEPGRARPGDVVSVQVQVGHGRVVLQHPAEAAGAFIPNLVVLQIKNQDGRVVHQSRC